VNKHGELAELYELASQTIALPIDPDSLAVQAFRLQLECYLSLNRLRKELDLQGEEVLRESVVSTILSPSRKTPKNTPSLHAHLA